VGLEIQKMKDSAVSSV
jgi:hypothetical protein